MKLNSVLILKGLSRYDVLKCFADELAIGFRALSCDVDIFDFNEKDAALKLRDVLFYKHYDIIISFNGMGIEILDRLSINTNTLFWSFLVDHPYFHHERLLRLNQNHIVSCIDKNHCEYLKKYYKNIDNVFFVPHGGSLINENRKMIVERDIDVTFIGSIGNESEFEELYNIQSYENRQIIDYIIDENMNGRGIPIDVIVAEKMSQMGKTDIDDFTDLMECLSVVDSYIRLKQRKEFIEKLNKNGIYVDIYGMGWECMGKSEYLRVHGPVNYEEALKVMSNSKIVLNKLPLFFDGSHERVFSTILCGGVCVTEQNKYFLELFEDGKDLLFYRWPMLDELVDEIRELLLNQSRLQEMADRAYEKVQGKHLWAQRALQIKDIYEKNTHISNVEYVNTDTVIDYSYNDIINYLNQKECELLSAKMHQNMHLDKNRPKNNTNDIYRQFLVSYSYESGAYDCSISELKNNLGEYVWLYNSLGDIYSKEVLCNIVRYRSSLDYKYIKSIHEGNMVKCWDFSLLNSETEKSAVHFLPILMENILDFAHFYPYKNNNIFVGNEADKQKFNRICLKENVCCDVCETDVLAHIDFSEVFGDSVGLISILNERMGEIVLRLLGKYIEKNKPNIIIKVNFVKEDLWKLANMISSYCDEYKFYYRYVKKDIVSDECYMYAI